MGNKYGDLLVRKLLRSDHAARKSLSSIPRPLVPAVENQKPVFLPYGEAAVVKIGDLRLHRLFPPYVSYLS